LAEGALEACHIIEQAIEDATQKVAAWIIEMGCPVIATQLRKKVHLLSVGAAAHVVEESGYKCLTAEPWVIQRALAGDQKTIQGWLEQYREWTGTIHHDLVFNLDKTMLALARGPETIAANRGMPLFRISTSAGAHMIMMCTFNQHAGVSHRSLPS
jgi:hypothetical protein